MTLMFEAEEKSRALVEKIPKAYTETYIVKKSSKRVRFPTMNVVAISVRDVQNVNWDGLGFDESLVNREYVFVKRG
jgi:hypothetical protein